MPTKEPSPNENPKTSDSESKSERKHRKHGYRGYPNNPSIGGEIHSGTGFAGVGSVSGTGKSSPDSSILTEHTEESLDELKDEEEE